MSLFCLVIASGKRETKSPKALKWSFLFSFNLLKGVTPWLVAWVSTESRTVGFSWFIVATPAERSLLSRPSLSRSRGSAASSVRRLLRGDVNLWTGAERKWIGLAEVRVRNKSDSNGTLQEGIPSRSAGASVSSFLASDTPTSSDRTHSCSLSFFLCFCSHFFHFDFIFLHIICILVYDSLWCLKLLFIPLSEMYKFISCFEPRW